MTLWHNAAFDLPALGVVTFEEDDEKTEALISDPVLVYTADGRMLVAEYEEDEAFAFRGWVQAGSIDTIDGVTHWTELPPPAEGGDAVIRLTKAEKAARYDALQAAIRFTANGYLRQRQECMTRYTAYGADSNIIAAYNKGMADALGAVAETLERWSDG